jgi:hypothetical protein
MSKKSFEENFFTIFRHYFINYIDMGSGNFYFQPAAIVKNVRKSRFGRSLLLAGMVLFGMSYSGKAQNIPVFQGGSAISVPFLVCQNSVVSSDFSSYLAASDLDAGEILTWRVANTTTVNGGTLGGFSSSQINTPPGSWITTTGLTYLPSPGFTGIDTFSVTIDDGVDGSSTTLVSIAVQALPSFNIDAIPAVCAGATSTTLSYSALSNVGPSTRTFSIVGSSIWVTPPGVTSVDFDVQGAAGGSDSHSPAGTANPGAGGRVTGTLNVNLVNSLNIYVGGRGSDGSTGGAIGGFNGGGNATFYFFGCGGAGGGASDIRIGGNALGNRYVVAGGGAGNGWDAPGPEFGGAGGNLIGGSSANNVGGGHSGGGTQSSGGAAAFYSGWPSGTNGSLGTGGDGSVDGISGGGGGGYYGGGGGVWTGGGGGSSYAEVSLTSGVTMTQGYNVGDGIVSLNYNVPGHYSISWDANAVDSGFVNVSMASLPASPITIAIPSGVSPGVYTGNITIGNMTCESIQYPISVTVNPVPDVTPPAAADTFCDQTLTSGLSFTGSVPGTTFNWVNSNPSIGIAGSGSGDITPYTATNTTPFPIVANITVTPTANGCTGTPVVFTIVVLPTPLLSSSLTPPDMCDSTVFNYNPTSLTPGTVFVWSVTPPSGIAVVYTSGAGNPGALFPPQTIYNSTPAAITVPFEYVLSANGCLAPPQIVNVNVNPQPTLISSLNPGAICDSTLVNYTPLSATSPVIFTWNRNLVTGISNTAATGSDNPLEFLKNTTPNPIAVPYIYRLDYGTSGCFNFQTVTITVNPTPRLNSGLTPPATCSGQLFSYGATSLTAGSSISWARGFTTGISDFPTSGITDSINESLTNTTPNPVTVDYQVTISANGCSHTDHVMEVINPTPRLSTTTTPSVCDSTVFNYPPASLTSGTTFAWSRAAVANITNPTRSGSGNPNEALVNTSPAPVVAIYVFTLTANGCTHSQNVNLTVNPKPMLSSTLTPPAICDSTIFSYNPSSPTAGSAYSWYRPYIPGIYAVASSGTGNPSQQLINSTYVVVNVAYTYTITANGCSNTQTVTVPVNPTPKLNPPFTATVCSGYPFRYTPASYTPGASFSWNRPAVAHVTPPTAFSTGGINETLINDQLVPVTTDYIYRLSINGCINLYTQTLRLTIKPTPVSQPITVSPAGNLCAGTQYMNFGVSNPQPGIEYTWTATNGTIVEMGRNHQFALVTFNTPGTSVITVSSNVNDFGCNMFNSVTVNVGNTPAQNIAVIYTHNQFVCLQNDNDSYQWGYDDASTLEPHVIEGEVDQNYNNSNPDFNNKLYWCITHKGDCAQKAYYNLPTGITNVNMDASSMKIYPNPANEIVNVEINSSVNGNMHVEVINVLGQKIDDQNVISHKASFNVGSLPAGCYLVDCYRDGIKVASSRFIKN